MSKARQSLERRDNIYNIAEEIVGDVKFVELLEAGEIAGKQLQTIAIEG